ncbi:kinase-like domain [Cordyceps militaris]|uniref:Kinase-like domain n=1 Tax=Cordyceps militaris TaxID=73501 RepID=A0A2H4SUX7_CORMI|nr:kinase-like domain [Cordyceps militaris]
MDIDCLAKNRADHRFAVWLKLLVENNPVHYAGYLAVHHCRQTAPTGKLLGNGAFNVCYLINLENGDRVVVRFTAVGRVVARREKVEDEVVVMRYLAAHSPIRVPKVFGHGTSEYGPYVVMEYIAGNLMSDYLRDPAQDQISLRPGLHPRVLQRAYVGMADILLELSKLEFPLIGALGQNTDGSFVVQKRPVTFNMNRISQFSNIPLSVFKHSTFESAGDYFEELARHHMEQLEHQKNDAIVDEADCRKKYVARSLFRRVSRKLCDEECKGPFRLFCDDLSPRNVIVDPSRLAVVGVVDWEFTYAAPAEFTYAAPWWLLLEAPECWDQDLNEFLVRYTPKFHVFIQALKECETEKIRKGALSESGRLSTIMENSVESGLFWVCLASRYSALFDEIYWTFIDAKFFGTFTNIEQRISLLDPDEKLRMENLVQEKMLQVNAPALDVHYTIDELVEL